MNPDPGPSPLVQKAASQSVADKRSVTSAVTIEVETIPGGDHIRLGVEHFGAPEAPLVLLVGGTTRFSWPDALCVALARGGRHVVRYDLRDSGASTTVDPEAPTYTLRDLAADAAALARELDERPAHLAGIGVGGMVAQVAALDYPEAFSALTPPSMIWVFGGTHVDPSGRRNANGSPRALVQSVESLTWRWR
jgi:pimeloyl-ACP methyl ester carboxylesterase